MFANIRAALIRAKRADAAEAATRAGDFVGLVAGFVVIVSVLSLVGLRGASPSVVVPGRGPVGRWVRTLHTQ